MVRAISLRLRMMFLLLLIFLMKAAAQEVLSDTTHLNFPEDSVVMLPGDSIPSDTLALKNDTVKSGAIDAPIHIHSVDSSYMVLEGKNMLYLFGKASVTQESRNLEAEYIELDADSSLLYATFSLDSIGEKFGFPVYTEGDQQYEMEKVWFNFKSKKMYIEQVITQQGEGYLTSQKTKKMPNDDLFLKDGRYTTCDDHDHPHWWFQLTEAKVRKGKSVVAGPTYLVIEDVPIPIAVPFGFFPFSKDYSSGILMPTFDDEMTRGFSLRNGGYYFAFSDYVDMELRGEIYTKGSWGLSTRSKYIKKYKFTGSIDAGYIVTITGDKDTKELPGSDYSKKKDFKVNWSHRQDQKANPFLQFSASVNFTTSTYNRNSLNEIYSNNFTDNNKSSTVQLTYKHPTLPISIVTNAAVSQTLRDTTLNVSFPNMTFTLSQIYPFKKKVQIGDPKWYEKIYLSYTGALKNSISNVKESEFLKKNVINDWQNGMTHTIPFSASFNLLKYISINPSVNYSGYWYTTKVTKQYDMERNALVPRDTLHGFYPVHNYTASIGANTKLYGMYKPLPILGKWSKGMVIRHMMTPSVSFSGIPDLSGQSFEKIYYTDPLDEAKNREFVYSYFENQMGGGGSQTKSGSLRISLDNNLEAKVPIAGTDSTRKVSIIDNFSLGTSYNFIADSLNWSDKDVSFRFKLFGHPLSFQTRFETYYYNDTGQRINKIRPGLGRFTGTQTGYSFSLNNGTIQKALDKLFGREGNKENNKNIPNGENEEGLYDEGLEEDLMENPDEPKNGDNASLLQKKKKEGEYDDDGYLMQSIPWNLSCNYSISYRYGSFNKEKREYDYKISQTMGISGSITPSKGWNFSFNTSYDFDLKKFAYMQCSLSREMHCWTMSASIMPVGPYQSYNFTIAVKSSILRDLKYTQSSNYRDAMNWGD
jgi:hypothetical protein